MSKSFSFRSFIIVPSPFHKQIIREKKIIRLANSLSIPRSKFISYLMSSTRNVRRMPQKPPRCISAIVNAQFFNVGTFLNINDNQTHEYWFLRGTLCCNNRPFCPLKMMMTKVTIYVGGNLIIRIIQAALQLFLKKGKFQYKTLFYECTHGKLPIQPHFCQEMMGIQHQQQASLDKINFCISDVTCCVVFW